jgi:hypothetical protein
VLHQARRGREEHIRGNRTHDDEIQRRRVDATLVEQLFRSFGSKIAGAYALIDKAPLPNARAFENPLVRRIESLLKIFIRNATLRQVVADGSNFRTE